MFVFCWKFRFFWGIQLTPFCHRSGIHGSTQCVNLPPIVFKKVLWIAPYANGMFRLFHMIIVSYYLIYIVAVKKEKVKWVSNPVWGPSYPIFEIATSHIWKLRRLETRVIKKWHIFLIKRVRARCLWLLK